MNIVLILSPGEGEGEVFEATYYLQSSIKEPVIGKNQDKVAVDAHLRHTTSCLMTPLRQGVQFRLGIRSNNNSTRHRPKNKHKVQRQDEQPRRVLIPQERPRRRTNDYVFGF